MAWSTSDRRAQLPPDWAALRQRVMARDKWSCQWRYPNGGRCSAKANQCDHINPKGGDSESNLRALCEKHHAWKSSSEGGTARAVAVAAAKARVSRPPERQPGEFVVPRPPLDRRGF